MLRVTCVAFPIVILTSNNERELPQAFLRRCLRLEMPEPDEAKLQKIVNVRLDIAKKDRAKVEELVHQFHQRCEKDRHLLANDQLLNAVYLLIRGIELGEEIGDKQKLIDVVLRNLQSNR